MVTTTTYIEYFPSKDSFEFTQYISTDGIVERLDWETPNESLSEKENDLISDCLKNRSNWTRK